MLFQRKADSQRRGKIFNACRHAYTRTEQLVFAADDSGAADFAAVDERQQHKISALVKRQLIFKRRRKAAFTAEKTFLIAAHAVAASYVKSVRRRQIFTVAVLRVDSTLQNLPAAKLLLVNQIQLINRGVAFVFEGIFAMSKSHGVLVIQNRIFAVVHEGDVGRHAIYFVVRPNETFFQLRAQVRRRFLVSILQARFVTAEGVYGERQSPRQVERTRVTFDAEGFQVALYGFVGVGAVVESNFIPR